MPGGAAQRTSGSWSATTGAVTGTRDLADALTWADTPLGVPSDWEPTLVSAARIVLDCPVAMALAYGPEHVLLYNDGYARLLGDRHPTAFGRPAHEALADVWTRPDVGPVLEAVYRTGESHLESDALLPVRRFGPDGPVDQVFFTRGMSVVRDPDGTVRGVLIVVAETTQATRRVQTFGELTSALATAVTLDDVARTTLRHGLTMFDAHMVGFGVEDETGWRTVRRGAGELLDEADERLPPLWHAYPADSPVPLVRAGVGGAAVYLSSAEVDRLHQDTGDRHLANLRSVAALPLRAPSLRGALSIGYETEHAWQSADRALLAATAEMVAQASERARLFETQHGTAQLMQRSMLPQSLPALDGYRLAARYVAGTDGKAAGGDFYDAFALPDGRVAVALGDVAGHDVRAAALMGQIRAGMRALALADPDPAAVLRGLDALVVSLAAELGTDELFVTVAYGVADAPAGELTLASAGHPSPLLRRPAGGGGASVTPLDVPVGAPLGLAGTRSASRHDLRPGDTLLLYSDGVVRRRGRSMQDGMDALTAAVGSAVTGDPRSLCAMLTRAVPGTAMDDVAVLGLEVNTAPSRSASLEVPAEPTGPGQVRRWLAQQLRAWGVDDEVAYTAMLCASELTTNALLHAGTPALVEVDLSAERLLVVVTDTGTRGPITRTSPEALASRGRGLNMIDSLADAWGSEPTVRGAAVWFEVLLPR
jgi:anti-sigma regulatory factor (Ser/Thr protein kinase)